MTPEEMHAHAVKILTEMDNPEIGMPSWDERIRGDREAIRIQEEMKQNLPYARYCHIQTNSEWKADIRQVLGCILMACLGLAFAIFMMAAAHWSK